MSCLVLVTGGSGFIGCYVARFLADRGDTVVNYDIRPTGQEMSFLLDDKRTQICFERGNIEDLPGLISVCRKHDIDRIVHTCGHRRPTLPAQPPCRGLSGQHWRNLKCP